MFLTQLVRIKVLKWVFSSHPRKWLVWVINTQSPKLEIEPWSKGFKWVLAVLNELICLCNWNLKWLILRTHCREDDYVHINLVSGDLNKVILSLYSTVLFEKEHSVLHFIHSSRSSNRRDWCVSFWRLSAWRVPHLFDGPFLIAGDRFNMALWRHFSKSNSFSKNVRVLANLIQNVLMLHSVFFPVYHIIVRSLVLQSAQYFVVFKLYSLSVWEPPCNVQTSDLMVPRFDSWAVRKRSVCSFVWRSRNDDVSHLLKQDSVLSFDFSASV